MSDTRFAGILAAALPNVTPPFGGPRPRTGSWRRWLKRFLALQSQPQIHLLSPIRDGSFDLSRHPDQRPPVVAVSCC